jgi:hypothetical protein
MTESCACSPNGANERICPICLEECDVETESIPRCGHSFHRSCIHQWLTHNTSCPVCRHTIVDDDSVEATRSDEPVVLSLQVSNHDTARSNAYQRLAATFVVVWLANRRPLLALWSLATLGPHTRCTMMITILGGMLVAPDTLVFSRHDVITIVIQCFLFYTQVGLWLGLTTPRVPRSTDTETIDGG